MTMRNFAKGRFFSFKYAFAGIWYVMKSQRNAWIHAVITLGVIILAFLLRLQMIEWVGLLLAIGLVWTAETMNTALEVMVDLTTPEIHPLAKIVKDVSAGAVLISAIISVLIGLIIFLPRLINVFQ